MVFEDYYNRFTSQRGSQRRSQNQIIITREEFDKLEAKAQKYDALVEEHKKIKTYNDKLLKELDDLKNDARKFKELLDEKEKFLNSLLRTRADFENFKKHSEQENKRYKSYIMENVLKKLIDHYDDLIRALNLLKIVKGVDGFKKGFEIIVKNFEKILIEEGVKPMNSEGELFDPYKHEAMIVEENRDDLPENTILEELTKGYYYKDKILRPAMVKISKKSKLSNLK
ncbi:MAG: nucleotide exchange factor GrpE [Candidatus Thorarchaeota archaeon]